MLRLKILLMLKRWRGKLSRGACANPVHGRKCWAVKVLGTSSINRVERRTLSLRGERKMTLVTGHCLKTGWLRHLGWNSWRGEVAGRTRWLSNANRRMVLHYKGLVRLIRRSCAGGMCRMRTAVSGLLKTRDLWPISLLSRNQLLWEEMRRLAESAERVRWVRKGCSPGMSPRPGNPLKSTLDWPPADELGPETDDGSFQSSFA